MDRKVKEYIAEVLKDKPLATISQEVSVAFRRGYLSSPRADYYTEHAVSLPLPQFVREYELTWEVHDEFSQNLLKAIPQLNELSFGERCKLTLPLLEKALENDARVTGFTRVLNETREGNRFQKLGGRLEYLLREAGFSPDAIEVFFAPATFISFEAELYAEVKDFFSCLSPEFLARLSSKEMTIEGLRNLPDFPKLQKMADRWTYGNLDQTISWLRPYVRVRPSMEKTLRVRRKALREEFERSKDSVAIKLRDLGIDKEFLSLVEMIQILLRMAHYVEPKSRFNMRGGLGDYLLRELVSRSLYQRGYLKSPNPMDLDQLELLEALKKACIPDSLRR